MKKFLINLWGMIDGFKDWLVTWLIRLLIFLLVCIILHTIVKMTEISKNYAGQYKRLITVYEEDSKLMNIYVSGDAYDEDGNPKEKIVILPAYRIFISCSSI